MQPPRSPLLESLFDQALQNASQQLDAGNTISPFLVEEHFLEGEEKIENTGISTEAPTDRLQRLRTLPVGETLSGYAIAYNGNIVVEDERIPTIMLEGALREHSEAQRWAVPYLIDAESGRATPKGLHFIEMVKSRFHP